MFFLIQQVIFRGFRENIFFDVIRTVQYALTEDFLLFNLRTEKRLHCIFKEVYFSLSVSEVKAPIQEKPHQINRNHKIREIRRNQVKLQVRIRSGAGREAAWKVVFPSKGGSAPRARSCHARPMRHRAPTLSRRTYVSRRVINSRASTKK